MTHRTPDLRRDVRRATTIVDSTGRRSWWAIRATSVQVEGPTTWVAHVVTATTQGGGDE